MFEKTRRFANWALEQGFENANVARQENPKVHDEIEKAVVREILESHNRSPKYVYQEESQSQVLEKNNVEIIDIDGTYIKTEERKSGIFYEGKIYTVEEFAAYFCIQKGYKVLETESVPFHALFGVLMWILIQDPSDPQIQIRSFGERSSFEEGREGKEIWTHLPNDFGTAEYAERRAIAIGGHFENIPNEKEELFWLFDYWVEPSEHLRQYLWAHRSQDVERARKLIEIFPSKVIHRILKYLVTDYWRRFTGWPDLLVYNDEEYFFVEVKSSGDKLREDQKSWIYGNTDELKLPFYLMKVHKSRVIEN